MEHYKYFRNSECEYYPCHNLSDDSFNCLFCYCPLYALGEKCGGNFIYLPNGIKSCENCVLPHTANGYEHIMSRIENIIEIAKE